MSGQLTEQIADTKTTPRQITASLCNGQLWMSIEGLGDAGSQDGHGIPLLVEIANGEPRVIVWADINEEDPTHIISLMGASETLRKEQS